MTARRRCFVISPIGAEGSKVREHADNVFEFIIQPAVADSGLDAVRSDHLHEPGRISEQMFREIVASDCCLAVLTGHNPNVFYELAVAHTVGTPVVALIEKGEAIPFDIHDLRCVKYDFSPGPLFRKVYANELGKHLAKLAAGGWPRQPLYAPLTPGQRLAQAGLGNALLAELSAAWDAKRDDLGPKQKRLLEAVEGADGGLTQHGLAEITGKPHTDDATFYRMEHLRLLGFIEKAKEPDKTYRYTLSPSYRAARRAAKR